MPTTPMQVAVTTPAITASNSQVRLPTARGSAVVEPSSVLLMSEASLKPSLLADIRPRSYSGASLGDMVGNDRVSALRLLMSDVAEVIVYRV